MKTRGKKYQDARKLFERQRLYEPEEALQLVQQMSRANFDETVEVAVRLGVNPKHADQQVRSTVVLPHGTGRTVRVLVFAKGEKAREAEEAGADIVGARAGRPDPGSWLVTWPWHPDMMGVVGKLGKILGPRGMMPPKSGTVT